MKKPAFLFPKLLILLSTAYAVVNLLHWPIGFTFFTQLSNLFLAAVVLLQLLAPRLRLLPGLKFSAVLSILVTFLVFLTVLGPVVPGGLIAAYAQDHGASFCLHLLNPALAMFDFFRNDALFPYEKRHALLALLPPFAYFLGILALGQLGLRWGPTGMMAPYPFLDYGSPAGWFGLVVGGSRYFPIQIGVFYAVLALLLLFYATAHVLLSLARRRQPGAPTLS